MKMNLWKQGKQDYKTFSEIPLKGFKSSLAFILSLVFTAIIILPIGIIIYQLLFVYGYHRLILIILIFFSWILLLLSNGLSNMITLELSKSYYPHETKLQNLSSKAVFVYQSLNIGFAIWTIVILYFVLRFI